MKPLEQKALEIIRQLRQDGYKAYFCGGSVRDTLLGCEPKDYDIVTDARPEDVQKIFPRTVLVGMQFGIIRVLVGNDNFEVATFRRDGTYSDGRRPSSVAFSDEREDACRRDFTVNGLFCDPETQQIVDYVGGQEDLRQKVIRTIGEPAERFSEDHLRLLRAVRFACQLHFQIEAKTWATIVEMSPRIARISAERIRDEILKMLTGADPARAFRLLNDSGLLRQVLPELDRLTTIPYLTSDKTCWDYTLLALAQGSPFVSSEFALATLFSKLGNMVGDPWHRQVETHTLLTELGRRLKLPKKSIEQMVQVALEHKKCYFVSQMHMASLKRFLRQPHCQTILELYKLECLVTGSDLGVYQYCQGKLSALAPHWQPPLLLNGNDLIQLGFERGAILKKILEFIEEKQLEGMIQTREEAVSLVRQHYSGQGVSH